MGLPVRNILPLWDHGWCDCNELELTSSESWQGIVSAYLKDESFQTSFVGPEFEHAKLLHGPFWRSKVNVEDFALMELDEFYKDIQVIRQPPDFREPVSEDQWKAVGDLLKTFQPQFKWRIKLNLTELDSDKVHDWGFVLDIFREYLLANPNSSRVVRLAFGYD